MLKSAVTAGSKEIFKGVRCLDAKTLRGPGPLLPSAVEIATENK